MSKTYMAIPPGETIKELLEDRDISQEDFAKQMNIDFGYVKLLLEGSICISKELATKLEKVFDIRADFWLSLEKEYQNDILKVISENQAQDYDFTAIPFSVKA